MHQAEPEGGSGTYDDLSNKGESVDEEPEEEEEAEDDIDEDELYLRLEALRTVDRKLTLKDANIKEMIELVEEADEAEAAVATETAKEDFPPIPLTDVDVMNQYMRDLPIEEVQKPTNLALLVQKMRKSLGRQNQKEEAREGEESYSPGNSPLYDPEEDDQGDVDSVSLTPSPGSSPIFSQSPALIIQATPSPLPATPSPNREHVDMELGFENEAEVRMLYQVQKEEREAWFPASVWEFGKGATAAKETDKGEEGDKSEGANIELGKKRKIESEGKESVEGSVVKRSKVDEGGREDRAEAGKVVGREVPEVIEVSDTADDGDNDDDEEEEAALRAKLLSDLEKKKKQKLTPPQSNKTVTKKPAPPATTRVSTKKDPPARPEKVPPQQNFKPRFAPAKNQVRSQKPQPKKQEKPLVVVANPAPAAKPVAVVQSRQAARKVIISPKPVAKVTKTKVVNSKKVSAIVIEDKNPHIQRLLGNKIIKRRHFPNLYKRVRFDLASSEDEEDEAVVAEADTETEANVGRFLKEMRIQWDKGTSTKTKKKNTPPPKPARKNPPPPKKPSSPAKPVQAANNKTRQSKLPLPKLPPKNQIPVRVSLARKVPQTILSPAKKAELMNKFDVNSLPPERRSEYMRLVAMLKRKEREHQEDLRRKNLKAVKTTSAEKEEDAEEMRKRLILEMKTKRVAQKKKASPAAASKVEAKKTTKTVKALPEKKVSDDEVKDAQSNKKTSLVKGAMKVSVSEKGRDVRIGQKKTTVVKPVLSSKVEEDPRDKLSPEDREKLKKSEDLVIGKRNELMRELYRISAQLSTLKGEKSKLKSLDLMEQELTRSLESVRKQKSQSETRIDKLSRGVKESQNLFVVKGEDSRKAESDCVEVGRSLLGKGYSAPSEHQDKINKKLDSIKANVVQLKVEVDEAAGTPEVAPSAPAVISDPSLEHIRQASRDTLSLDPHKELCRFELQGKCNDDSCPFQHYPK